MRSEPTGLFDREKEIAAIEELLSDATDGAGRLAVVRGGAGAGKTALLDAAVSQARRSGFTVLMARGSLAERDLWFGLASRLFDGALPHAMQPELAFLTATQEEVDARPSGAEPSLAELRALHRALAAIAADSPVLVAIDDLQWVDPQSLRWLSTLPQRIEQAGIAVIATVCNGEPCSDAAVLDDVLAVSATELRPADLSLSAATDLFERALVATPDTSFVTACMQATGGNPMLLSALAVAATEPAAAPTADAVPALIDDAVSRLASCVNARLRRISPHALAIARTVAVLGTQASPTRVTDIVGIDGIVAAETAMALCRVGLLRISGQTVAFAHPLLRRIVVREAPYTALQAVHAKAARLLHTAGAPEASVAAQLIATPPLAEPWVPAVLRSAAGAALGSGHPDTAITCLRRALAEPLSQEERRTVLLDLGLAEAQGDVVAAIRHLTEAADLYEEREQPFQLTSGLTTLLDLTGRHRPALDLINAKADTTSFDTALRTVELRFRDETTAAAAAEQLEGLAESAPEGTADHGRLLSLLAMRETWAGQSLSRALELARQALVATPAASETAEPFLRSVLVLAQAGAPEEAYEQVNALVRHAERRRRRLCLAAARSVRSVVERQFGRLPAAAEDARQALELLLTCGTTRRTGASVEFLARLVEVLVDLGNYDEAEGLIEVSELTGEVPRTWAGTALLLARGRLRVATGDPADGIGDLLKASTLLRAWNVANPAVAPWRSRVATALLAMGDETSARQHAAEEVESARRWGAPEPIAFALRAQAAADRGPQELAVLEESTAVLERSSSRLERARCLTEYGTALNRARQTVEARRALRTALDLAEESGASKLALLARLELSASGGRRAKPRRTGIDGLTAAELRTATLAATGKTNRELAEILFVQRRTVEIHLTNTYRKLGINGRSELAAVLRHSEQKHAVI
ncbi:AAA family ATPase [Streptomyces sp. KR80]|uniref:AAA family ATPase n=1 Tax=Streptomyces sp. KR80 TaxID=3457426 RepID=UPI003FD1AE6D